MNEWLRGRHRARGFGCYDLGRAFERPGMMRQDGACLNRWGKRAGQRAGWACEQGFTQDSGEGDAPLSDGSQPGNSITSGSNGEILVGCPKGFL